MLTYVRVNEMRTTMAKTASYLVPMVPFRGEGFVAVGGCAFSLCGLVAS